MWEAHPDVSSTGAHGPECPGQVFWGSQAGSRDCREGPLPSPASAIHDCHDLGARGRHGAVTARGWPAPALRALSPSVLEMCTRNSRGTSELRFCSLFCPVQHLSHRTAPPLALPFSEGGNRSPSAGRQTPTAREQSKACKLPFSRLLLSLVLSPSFSMF